MLHNRLRPLHRFKATTATAAPSPEFNDDDQIQVEETSEDFFEASLPILFPDDAPQFHGDPGQHLLYKSPSFGDLEIMVPSYPTQTKASTDEVTAESDAAPNGMAQVQRGRELFAHFVWSASLLVAEGVESAHLYEIDPTPERKEAYKIWNVTDQSVLELGAGAALPSLISILANASTVVATDHPLSPALAGATQFNMDHNLCNRSPVPPAEITIQPHQWGALDDSFSLRNKGAFTRIIGADCYWMRAQHENLVRTMQWFLAPGGKVLVVTGLHTGRKIVKEFFETALKNGFQIERIYERDLTAQHEDDRETRREWLPERNDEGPENRARWCIVCVLKRAE